MSNCAKYLLLIVCGLLLIGCKQEPKYKIGVSQCSNDDWRRKMNEEIMREAMFHDDIAVEIRSADDNSAKQIEDLKYFKDNNFDIIIVAPNEANALTEPINEIYHSGKPIIVFDRTINNEEYTAFQGADNRKIGSLAANYAKDRIGTVNVMEIRGLRNSTPAEFRHLGFKQKADSIGVNIVCEGYGDWIYEKGKHIADSLLDLYPQTNVIYAHNDRMAIGASEAAKAKGRDDIVIIGIDAAPTIGMKAVQDGVIDATFLYPTEGGRLVTTALDILEGKKFEKNSILPTVAPVTNANAEILLLQDNKLREETQNIEELQTKLTSYLQMYTMQKSILIGVFIILALLAITIFAMLHSYWSSRRHKEEIEKRNQELQRQRDELDNLYHQLQEATGSKLAWFTNVSHDLRTPLTLIADPIHQIVEAENLTPKQRTQLQLADKNVKRLERLVNQILDIRKYDNEQLRIKLTNVDLSEAIRSWAESFSDLAVRRHINFVIDIPEGQHIHTAVDIEKCERIFFNLLSNAFKFTPENGTITISHAEEGGFSVLKVTDTGRGMPEEDIQNIFKRFFRTETVNPNGSGIGLALSKVFIDMQGGTIEAASEVGKGSSFTVKLPIRKAEDAEETTSFAPQSIDVSEIEEVEEEIVEIKEDTPAVLVIDDNKDICSLIKSVMSDNYTVITTNSGTQGIKLAVKYVPDLIICDVMMPDTDGYEVCRTLKKDELTSHIPVLLLTACALDEQRIEGYDCGADAYMSKPFDSAMLLSRCKSLITNRNLIYKKEDVTTKEGKDEEKKKKSADIKRVAEGNAIDDDFLSRFVGEVEKRITDSELSVEALADIMGISRVQLYRKIKALTNYSAAEMVRNIRLKKAATMLKTTDSTVSEVAYAVGFSTPNYFTRCYKEYFGESPSETQARYKGR